MTPIHGSGISQLKTEVYGFIGYDKNLLGIRSNTHVTLSTSKLRQGPFVESEGDIFPVESGIGIIVIAEIDSLCRFFDQDWRCSC